MSSSASSRPFTTRRATLGEFSARLVAAAARARDALRLRVRSGRRWQHRWQPGSGQGTDCRPSLDFASWSCGATSARPPRFRRASPRRAAISSISMDSDLQHFPEDLPLFLNKIEEGYDLVCGWRHDRQEGMLRRWPSQRGEPADPPHLGAAVHDVGTTYRAYRADLVQQLQLVGEQHRFVPVLAALVGARSRKSRFRTSSGRRGSRTTASAGR